MTQDLNTQDAAVELNTNGVDAGVDANVTANADSTTAAKKRKSTIAKADLTQDFLKSKLELRVDLVATGEVGEDGTMKLDEAGQPLTKAFNNFYWLADTTTSRIGDLAGSRRPTDGYHSLVLSGTNYSGGQLAYFYENGEWPKKAEKVVVESTGVKRVRKPVVLDADGKPVVEVKEVKEVKIHEKRVFTLPTAEEKAAAVAAQKARLKKRKDVVAAKVAAEVSSTTPDVAAESTAAAPSEAPADTADIDSVTL